MKIYAIVAVYNGRQQNWIKECLDSITRSTLPVNIIAIDNGSTDGSVDFIQQNYKQVDLIRSDKNSGFGAANNIGIRKALDAGFDFLFLLNQDAYVFPDSIQQLIELHKQQPEYGILSPVHLADNGNVIDKTFLRSITDLPGNLFISDLILGQKLSKVYSFPFVNAAIWSISRKCIENVGGFDPIFLHYGEDADYCKRVLARNLLIGVSPEVRAVHNRSQADSRRPIDAKKKLLLSYLLHFKEENSSLTRLSLQHLKNSFLYFASAFLRLRITTLFQILSVNLQLFGLRRQIQKSRHEQKNKLAFLTK